MCEHKQQTYIDGFYTCTQCGNISDKQKYITSYDRSFTYRRPPVYSRQKRFLSFIRNMREDVLFLRENDILMVFGYLEFFFNMGHKFQRIYFFNRFVTLTLILEVLEIPLKTKTLKDQVRVEQQLSEMRQILKFSLFS